MKSTAPWSLRCADLRGPAAASLLALVLVFTLNACQTTKKIVPAEPAAPLPSFACDTTVQEIICSNATLAKLDQEMTTAFRHKLRQSDSIGREQLMASQNRWLIGRAQACAVPTLRLDGATPSPILLSCLNRIYAEHVAVLRQWPPAAPPAAPAAATPSATAHPISAYVEFRSAQYADAPLCGMLAETINGVLRTQGDLDFARIPGITLIAGSHGEARAQGYSVDLQDAGPYAGYALRAHTLKDGSGRTLIDESSLGHWVRRLPNHGGRANSAGSQTGDYASIDVFRSASVPKRTLALVAEPWGRDAPGAQGEWAFAGVYQVGGSSSATAVEPLCLYRTYMTPPLKNELAQLTAYNTLQKLLTDIHGPASSELVDRDSHDDYLYRMDQQWMLQNMSLLAVADAQRKGWSGWLRSRHDAVLDALFAWSERSLRHKLVWRQMLTLLPSASEELATTWQRTQRLSEDDSRQAAHLALMRLLAQQASDLPGLAVNMPNAPTAALARYQPKYPILATEGDLQRDRSYSGLYSAALNGADAEAIDDYLKYEADDPQKNSRQTRGANGETPLMAAVESPAIVRQLLAAGHSANEADALGRTALMNAAYVGQAESTRLLIGAGASIGARSKTGETACQTIRAGAGLPASERSALQGLLCK